MSVEELQPDFNGLSSESFKAGTEMLSTWGALDPAKRAETMPHIIGHMTYELLGNDLTPAELRELADASQRSADSLRRQAERAEVMSVPPELRADDY